MRAAGKVWFMENWFEWYCEQLSKTKKWAAYRERFLCPCCYMPTLKERAEFNICWLCFWEDDGQDSDDAKVIRGGPNADYSLEEARRNFVEFRTMFRPSDTHAFSSQQKRRPTIDLLYGAFTDAILSGSENVWLDALKIEAKTREERE